MSSLVVVILGLFMAALGLLGVVAPPRLIGFVRSWQTPTGLYAAAALRLVLGVALFLAAPTSRAPDVLQPLGVFVFAAGVATPFFGLERFRKLLDWWSARGSGFLRTWACFALGFGLLLVYAVVN
jgi:hypothetical protein